MTTLNTIIEEEVEAYKNDYAQAITDVGGFGLAKHIERFLTTAMQRAYKKGKADSTQENDPSYKFVANRISKPLVATKFVNTPDTEWEKWVRTLSNSTNPRDTDLLIAKIAVLLTSRDTYWKERVVLESKRKDKIIEMLLARMPTEQLKTLNRDIDNLK